MPLPLPQDGVPAKSRDTGSSQQFGPIVVRADVYDRLCKESASPPPPLPGMIRAAQRYKRIVEANT